MATEKLFTPEDFDKPKNKPWLKKSLIWIATIVFLCTCGYLYKDSLLNGNKSDSPVVQTPPTIEKIVQEEGGALSNEQPQQIAEVDSTTQTKGITISHNQGLHQITCTRGETLEIDAKMAIRGDFGNGLIRKQRLGSDYKTVQNIVNQFVREGKIKW